MIEQGLSEVWFLWPSALENTVRDSTTLDTTSRAIRVITIAMSCFRDTILPAFS